MHNEAVQMLDILAAAAVEEPPRTAPPATPQVGATYIVAAGATGAWVGQDLNLAGFTDGGWRFVTPREGTMAYVVSGSVWSIFREGAWEMGSLRGDNVLIGGEQVVGARAAAIGVPTGGSTVDTEARSAVGQILSALRTHGLIEN